MTSYGLVAWAAGSKLERKEAIALLKELVEQCIVQPSLVSVEKKNRGDFELILKIDCDIQPLRLFVSQKNLAIREEQERCIIFKP